MCRCAAFILALLCPVSTCKEVRCVTQCSVLQPVCLARVPCPCALVAAHRSHKARTYAQSQQARVVVFMDSKGAAECRVLTC
jgi:hypothetical protein